MDLKRILRKFGISVDPTLILNKWNESHRSYNNLSHLQDLISQINEDFGDGQLSENDRDKLIVCALFHNIIYEPLAEGSEKKSVEFFLSCCNEKFDIDIVEIKQIILDTKSMIGSTPLSKKFINYDMKICERSLSELKEWENGIREEYSELSNEDYKSKRIKFLESSLDRYPLNVDNILDLISYVRTNYV